MKINYLHLSTSLSHAPFIHPNACTSTANDVNYIATRVRSRDERSSRRFDIKLYNLGSVPWFYIVRAPTSRYYLTREGKQRQLKKKNIHRHRRRLVKTPTNRDSCSLLRVSDGFRSRIKIKTKKYAVRCGKLAVVVHSRVRSRRNAYHTRLL